MYRHVGVIPGLPPGRKFGGTELVQALRLDAAAARAAVHLYLNHAAAAADPLAEEVLRQAAGAEESHVRTFERLVAVLTGDEECFAAPGDGYRAAL